MNQMSYVWLFLIVIDRFTAPPGVVVAASVAKDSSAGAGAAAFAEGARPKSARARAMIVARPRRLVRVDLMAGERRRGPRAPSAPGVAPCSQRG